LKGVLEGVNLYEEKKKMSFWLRM